MRIGVVGNKSKETLPDAIEVLLKIGAKYDIDFFFHDDLESQLSQRLSKSVDSIQFLTSKELIEEIDMLVSFGGDGTILSAARMIGRTKIPILGINLGKLGFLAEVSLDELESFIHEIVNGHHIIEERMMLRTTIGKEKQEYFSLNDVVIDNSSSSRLINISVYVNEDYLVSYSGDGIIIATPTGSTAYSLAAGGPIVDPTTEVFVVQPISPHSLSARTVIVPDDSVVRIVVEHLSDEARLTVDGQLGKVFTPPMNITIQKADFAISLIKRNDRSYYDILRAKLFWGSDIRLIKGKKDE